MKKVLAALAVLALLLLILTPLVVSVNSAATQGVAIWADGGAPPPPFPSRVLTIIVADGGAPPPPFPS